MVDPGAEVPLQDTSHRRVVKVGDTVHRPVYPWSNSIHALLRHLEAVGFPFSPRVLGIDEQGREVLSYLEGDSGPKGWARVVDERGLVNSGRLLRMLHEAVATWRPDESLLWSNGKQGAGEPGDTICHGDFGPWNIVWNGVRPVGLIDWDYAYPGPAWSDIVYAIEYVVPFRDDAECMRWLAYREPPNRRRRLEIFVEAYGLNGSANVSALAEQVVHGQREMLENVKRFADQGLQPHKTWVEQGHLTTIENRIRWSEANLHLFR